MVNSRSLFSIALVLALAPAAHAGVGDPECRDLTEAQVKTEASGALNDVRSVVLRPTGACAYATSFAADALVSYSVGTSGTLTFELSVNDNAGPGLVDGLDGATHAAVSPDNQYIYVAGEIDDAVAVFELPDDTPPSGSCELDITSFVEAKTDSDLNKARSVALDPSGDNVYVASANGDAIVTFDRNSSDGTLTIGDSAVDGVDGFTCLNGATSVVVSADGECLYVAAESANKLCVIDRDTSDGSLSQSSEWVDAQSADQQSNNIVANLKGARWVTISPDDDHIYVAAPTDDAVLVFERDATGCDLTFVEDWLDSEITGGGLNQVSSIDVTPDGGRVYASAKQDDAVVEFLRDPSTGELTSPAVAVSGTGLNGALGIYAEDQRLYVSASINDSVTTYEVNSCCGDATLHRNEDCDNPSACCASDCTVALDSGSLCGDLNGCTGPDTCDANGVCLSGPCNVPNACTTSCGGTGTCATDGTTCGCQPD